MEAILTCCPALSTKSNDLVAAHAGMGGGGCVSIPRPRPYKVSSFSSSGFKFHFDRIFRDTFECDKYRKYKEVNEIVL